MAIGYLFIRAGKVEGGKSEKLWIFHYFRSYSNIFITVVFVWTRKRKKRKIQKPAETSVKGKKAVVELLMKIRVEVWVV